MRLHNVLHDRQAEAGAALVPRTRHVDPVEALEDPVEGLAGNAGTIIGHPQFCPAQRHVSVSSHPHRTSRATVLDRVVDEIEEHLLKAVGIHTERKARGQFIEESGIPFPGPVLEILQHPFHHRTDGTPMEVHHRLPGFELGDGEQIVNEKGEAVGVLLDGAQEPFRHLRIRRGPVDERLDEALDQRQRRAQFMTDIRHELPPGPLQLLQPGEIVKDQDHPGPTLRFIREGGGVHLQNRDRSTVQLQLQPKRLPLAPSATREIREFMAPHRLDQSPAPGIPHHLEQPRRRPIQQPDPVVPTHHRQAVEHAVQHRLEPRPIPVELGQPAPLELTGLGKGPLELLRLTTAATPPPEVRPHQRTHHRHPGKDPPEVHFVPNLPSRGA